MTGIFALIVGISLGLLMLMYLDPEFRPFSKNKEKVKEEEYAMKPVMDYMLIRLDTLYIRFRNVEKMHTESLIAYLKRDNKKLNYSEYRWLCYEFNIDPACFVSYERFNIIMNSSNS